MAEIGGVGNNGDVFPDFRGRRTVVEPPMSMFSIASSSVRFGLAMVAAEG